MDDFRDYSYAFGMLDKWTSEQFKSELAKYNELLKETYNQISRLNNRHHTLSKNIDYFKRRINEMRMERLEKDFVLKPEHKRILKAFTLYFDGEGGSPRTNGLSYLYRNYRKLVFEKDDDDLSQKEQDALYLEFEKLMDEIPFAIHKLAE